MDFWQAVAKRRTVRSFSQDPIDQAILTRLVDAARVSPAAANMQPLEYVVVTDPAIRAELFTHLKWAAYIVPRGNPAPDKTPTAYIAVAVRDDYQPPVPATYDVGAAIQTILLGAVASGLGGCWLKAVNYPKASSLLGLPKGCKLDSVVALGYPDEEPRMVDLAPEAGGLEEIKYWRDDSGQHFVPKRNLATVMHIDKYGNRG